MVKLKNSESTKMAHAMKVVRQGLRICPASFCRREGPKGPDTENIRGPFIGLNRADACLITAWPELNAYASIITRHNEFEVW